ncbi:MAG: hypothetical protein ACYTFK_13980, partial [Planctomycetota bacterium]|jgi:hypothetical protein
MKRITKNLVLMAAINSVLLVVPYAAFSEENSQQASTKLQQVALFKNGLAFFVSEAIVPKNKKSFHIVPSAAASHGTFWVAYPEKVKVKRLVVKETKVNEPVEAVTIAELLKANVGKNVKLYFPDPDEPMVEGKILYFAQDRERVKPEPYAPGGIGGVVVDHYRGGDWRSRLAIIGSANGQVAINPDIVRRVDFANGDVARSFANKKDSMQLDIELGSRANGQKLLVSYLGKGVTWAPSYVVDITEEDNARISAKAAVINEACDLDDVTIQLVTGFPHLQFADVLSPLALKENLAQFLQSLIKGESERGRDAAVMFNVMRQSASSWRGSDRRAVMPAYGAAEAGKVSEDLFFYPLENVQLARGQVGYFPLFTETVPYKHIYEWKIPDYVNTEDRYRRRREEEREPEEEVWHSLRLQNTAKLPWTTAPAQILKEDLILGQDTLNYTPVQGKTTVRITRAVSVKAEQVEFEIDRKRDAMRMYGDHFDLITIQGKLSATNLLPKQIKLEITKTLSGEVKSSEPEAKIEKLAQGLHRMNTTAELTWTLELKPDEHKEIGYTYDVYVRR